MTPQAYKRRGSARADILTRITVPCSCFLLLLLLLLLLLFSTVVISLTSERVRILVLQQTKNPMYNWRRFIADFDRNFLAKIQMDSDFIVHVAFRGKNRWNEIHFPRNFAKFSQNFCRHYK